MAFLRDDLLNPVPGPNPSGENLRYAPVYDKIKEARQEDEDDSPQGDWQKARKKADLPLVIKLAGDALANKSKDLQLAGWLCEAIIRREGFAAVPECIDFFRSLQETFWNTLYPEIEDGSPEFRATPQEWFSGRCDQMFRRLPLTANKLNWLKYRESRAVGYEADTSGNDSKLQVREEAIKEGKLTAEEFDEDFNDTPKQYYEDLAANLDSALESLSNLDSFCDEKYGSVSPNFARLRGALEELKQTGNVLLERKREKEPDEASPEEPVEEARESVGAISTGGAAAAAAPARVSRAAPVGEPKTPEDAFLVVLRMAEYLRAQDPSSAAPYLLPRALRFGELRSQGDVPDPVFLAAPATEVRQQIKRLYTESSWEELLSAAEAAAGSPCGRAWLDIQRYAWHACDQLYYAAAAKAICGETRAILADYPELPSWTLADDTPTANPDTRSWINDHVLPPKEEGPLSFSAPLAAAVAPEEQPQNGVAGYFEAALQLARGGRIAEALQGLTREAVGGASGRERFRRQLQVSTICLTAGHFAVAYPILQGLVSEIENRGLLDWEDRSLLAQPLALLVQCIDRTSQDPQERARVYNLLCRLEPESALHLGRP